ncbi:penicillin acylase family protein [Streptomyces sp. SKN60]|uniref:penicillin acylase family protein n=1 Tax=Streptomyces sp. SKN60 TaxID=2855506 RepID=UPI002247A2D6|nr:penicillin acylase family protein [Streptomyces sp. SKN60]MCX2182982.1 penicillin acylase family protein [Streptomyces sp. SKN60]
MSIEVFRDAWGVPHLRAADPRELARAQGLVTARDRAWQLEVERHRAQGTSATFLGAAEAGWDVFVRQARLADTARRCHDRLDAETAAWVRAYVDGVNEGLAEGARRAPEFAATGLRPGRWEPWTPLAVWLSTHILFAGFPTKLWRDRVAARLGEEWTELFAADGPGTAGSNGWLLSGARTASGAPLVAGDPHRFIEAPGVYQQIRLSCPDYDVLGLAVPGVPGLPHFGHAGRVAWAITNAMADYQDLYRERLRRLPDGRIEALGPTGWEPATAHTETVRVRGAAAPVRVEVVETARGPVIIGAQGAFGAGGGAGAAGGAGAHAAGGGGRREAGTGEGAGAGAGEATEPDGAAGAFGAEAGGVGDAAQPDDTGADGTGADGPDTVEWEAISLRHPPRVTGELGFASLPALLRARSVGEVDRALGAWVEPVNVVQAADVDGGLLHRVAGHVPVRDRANALRVVPAWEARHAWADAPAPLPRAEVGAEGYAVMANARGLAAPLGVEFAPPHRAERIGALLAASDAWTPAATAAVHTDTDNPSARRLLERIGATDEAALSPAARRVRATLLGWDRRMAADSTDAGLYAAVRGAVVRRTTAHDAFAELREPAPYPELFQPWLALGPRVGLALETLLTGAGPVPAAELARIVREALEEVGAGDPPPAWGVTHRLAPWQALPDEDDASWPGLAGDQDCVLSSSSVPGYTDRSARASAARYVWDLADRERSRWIVPFGASGVPGDPHHRDQLPLWLRGELAPVTTNWTHLVKEDTDDEQD